MNPTGYELSNFLLSKGFKKPYIRHCKFLASSENGYPVLMQGSYLVFVRGEYKVGLSKEGCDVCISHKNFKIWTAQSDFENIEQVIDAIIDPKQIPLCMGISWAAPLVEFLFKKGRKYENLKRACGRT